MLGEAMVVWDVDGHMALYCNDRREGRHVDYHVRCFAGDRCVVRIDDVTYPVPGTMTAFQYFDAVFRHAFGPPDRQRGTGD